MYKWEHRPTARDVGVVEEHDTIMMPDLLKSAVYVKNCVINDLLIRIFGDYDSDGMNSSNILFKTLKDVGGRVQCVIPERKDGYGLSTSAVISAKRDGVDLLIAVDNGSSAFPALEKAKELDMPVIIIDHHNIPSLDRILNNPTIKAFVNPHRQDYNYPMKELCATLLAYKFADALYDLFLFPKNYAKKYMDIVAIGTIGDIMPIVGENRKVVVEGLAKANENPSSPVKALSLAMGIDEVNIKSVGFQIVPALNSSSRLGNASESFALLIAPKNEVKEQAKRIAEQNETRKELKARTIENLTDVKTDCPVIYYHNANIDYGIVGLISSYLTDTYKKPSIVTTEVDGKIKGSGRSISGFKLYDFVMSFPPHYFIGRGGHDEALGLELDPMFHKDFMDAIYNANVTVPDFVIYYEDELSDVDILSRYEVEKTELYGHGYEKPVYKLPEGTIHNKKKYDYGIYGTIVINGQKFSFSCTCEYNHIKAKDRISGVYEIESTKKGELRLKFLDLEVLV